MNEDILKGNWEMLKGKIKEKWGKLTDQDLTEAEGKRDYLLGAIRKRYGVAQDVAEKEYSDWESHLNRGHHEKHRHVGEDDTCCKDHTKKH